VPSDFHHALTRSCGRDESDESKGAIAKPLFAPPIRADGDVGDEYSARARICRARQSIGTGREHWIEVTEENNRNLQPGALDEIEHPVICHSIVESALGARLDDRPVGNWVGERHPELDDVGAPFLEGVQDGQ
jgi:hypothetical protein